MIVRTAYDAYQQSLQLRPPSGGTPFSPIQQSIEPQTGFVSKTQAATQATGARTKAVLENTSTNAYRDFIDNVVNGRITDQEQADRNKFLQTTTSNMTGYVDPTSQNARTAIQAARQYANIHNDEDPYDVGYLTWGGPGSGKSGMYDFMPSEHLFDQRLQGEELLKKANIPDWLATATGDKLSQKWVGGWRNKFGDLAADRAQQIGNWWDNSDWVNRAYNPGETEVIDPEKTLQLTRPWRQTIPGTTIPGRLAGPGDPGYVPGTPGTPGRNAGPGDPGYVPESWNVNQSALNAYIANLDNTMVVPGQTRKFYYDTSYGTLMPKIGWKDGKIQRSAGFSGFTGANLLDNPMNNILANSTSGTQNWYLDWIVDRNKEEVLHDQSLNRLRDYITDSAQSIYTTPSARNQTHRYLSGRDYSDWFARINPSLIPGFNQVIQDENRINGWNLPTFDPGYVNQPRNIDYRYTIPTSLINYESEQRPWIPPVPGTDPIRPWIPPVVTPDSYVEHAGRDVRLPALTRWRPPAKKSGFETVRDPITGVDIPNYYLYANNPNNPALTTEYGAPAWYLM